MRINTTFEDPGDIKVNTGIGLFTGIDSDGIVENLILILNCRSEIKSSNFASVGSIVGVNNGLIQNCGTEGKIEYKLSGQSGNLGGVAGDNWGIIKNCFNGVSLDFEALNVVNIRLGGICGAMSDCVMVKNCYNYGDIKVYASTSDQKFIGGITGRGYCNKEQKSILENVFNIGKIQEEQYVSGNGMVFDECIAYKRDLNFSCAYSLNGLISSNNPDSTVKHFGILNEELSGKAGVILLNKNDEDKVWIEDVNKINKGYPILKWQEENN